MVEAVDRERRDSAGAAWADMDADGDLDLFVANWGSADQVNRLCRNTTSETTGRSWIGFRLRAEGPNTHAWGAKVRAKAVIQGEPRWMTRWNLPTTGYASQNQLLVHFGLDDAERVDSLVVRWPSGREELHTDLEARRYWTLLEGAAGTGSTASRRTIRRPGTKRQPAIVAAPADPVAAERLSVAPWTRFVDGLVAAPPSSFLGSWE